MKFAYIFDFDGVLVRTMEAHFRCYRQALEEVGVAIDRAQFYRQAGMTGREQIRYFADRAGVSVDVEAVYRRKRAIWETGDCTVTAIDCNVTLLRSLRAVGAPVAIASGSSRESVLPVMREHGLEVDVVVGAEDVTRGKPHPDLFLCAAGRLNRSPGDCIVVEDSDVGIEAARAAGMKVMRFFDNEGDS
jgi:beta-phosphoglucomutase-like phosphatase (HAD superfamily)